jgi:quercetin dioxygenase-like cupin family protein
VRRAQFNGASRDPERIDLKRFSWIPGLAQNPGLARNDRFIELQHSLPWKGLRNSQKKEQIPMKRVSLYEENSFDELAFKRLLVHDSPYFKILNFNFKAGQELPVHSHEIEGQVSIAVLEGSGEFLGKDESTLPAEPGDVLVSEIAEPHGVRAKTDMRVLVTIAPPI